MEFKEITEKIIGAAYKVYNRMGYGFLETVYEKCMLIELRKLGLDVVTQKSIKVCYDNEVVGEYKADIIVNDKIIVELKSISQITTAHEVQLVNYLVATGLEVGLILNFAEKKVEVKRKVRELKK